MNQSQIRREIDRLRAEILARRDPGSAADDIAGGLGLDRADPLVSVLLAAWVEAKIADLLREAGEDGGPSDGPSPILGALGLPGEATGEAILEAARSGLDRDPDGFRRRVLAAGGPRTGAASRYLPGRRVWASGHEWWLTAEEWATSLSHDEASVLAMTANPPKNRRDIP